MNQNARCECFCRFRFQRTERQKKQTMVFLNNECGFPLAIRVFWNLTNPFSFQSIPHSPPTNKCQKVPVCANSELRNDFLNTGSNFLNFYTTKMETCHCSNWPDENCLVIYQAINLKRLFQERWDSEAQMQKQKMIGYYYLEKTANHSLKVFEILEIDCT